MRRARIFVVAAALLFGGISWSHAQQFGTPVGLPDNALLPPIAPVAAKENAKVGPPEAIAPPKQPAAASSRPLQVWTAPHVEAARTMGLPVSNQRHNGNINDRQDSHSRPGGAVMNGPASGVTFYLAPAMLKADREKRALLEPDRADAAELMVADPSKTVGSVTFKANARGDLIVDSTRMLSPAASGLLPAPNGLFPSLVPAKGDPFFGAGPRSTVANGSVSTQFSSIFTTNSQDLGPTTIRTDALALTQNDGTETLLVQNLYAQLAGSVVVGKAASRFSDPDSIPLTVEFAGPNAQIYAQHLILAYNPTFSRTDQTTFAGNIAVEQSETSVFANKLATVPIVGESFGRIPDITANLSYKDNTWGHVQLAGVLRNVSIDNSSYTIHQGEYGAGINLSGSVIPFSCGWLKNDIVSWGAVYGRGIGNYVLDLRASGAGDGAVDAKKILHTLPVTACFLGYSHIWSDHWRTTVVYSYANLHSIADEGPTAYRSGTYVVANVVYTWQFQLPNDPNIHAGFVGLEYGYAEKETLGNGKGHDQRVQFTVALNY